jgi:hypothetical protein
MINEQAANRACRIGQCNQEVGSRSGPATGAGADVVVGSNDR